MKKPPLRVKNRRLQKPGARPRNDFSRANPLSQKLKKSPGPLNVLPASIDQMAWEQKSLPNGHIRRERPSTPSAHMALTRPVVPPDGSFISYALVFASCRFTRSLDVVSMWCQRHQSMIRKSVQRFSENHALGPDPWDHAQSKSESAVTIQADVIAL
jgi:hypothetical protein